jgi:hypothetical protein
MDKTQEIRSFYLVKIFLHIPTAKPSRTLPSSATAVGSGNWCCLF